VHAPAPDEDHDRSIATSADAEGLLFALGLTAVVITTMLGPARCLYWRLTDLEYRTEDRRGQP
jgi:hypothetical protein